LISSIMNFEDFIRKKEVFSQPDVLPLGDVAD
jgi:hypothetical protein